MRSKHYVYLTFYDHIRWYLGIQSKKDPAHVMNEVYKAMQALKCVWHQVNNYRVLCLWKYTSGAVPKQSSPTVSSSVSYFSSFFAAMWCEFILP